MTEIMKSRCHRFQCSLRTLMLVVLLASIVMSWVAVEIQAAKRQREAVEAIVKLGGEVDGDGEFHRFGVPYHRSHCGFEFQESRGPRWLRNLLGVDIFAEVSAVIMENEQVTDGDLEHLKALKDLKCLVVDGTCISDDGLKHLEGLSQLEVLNLRGTQVTNQGVKRLKQALPNCKIQR